MLTYLDACDDDEIYSLTETSIVENKNTTIATNDEKMNKKTISFFVKQIWNLIGKGILTSYGILFLIINFAFVCMFIGFAINGFSFITGINMFFSSIILWFLQGIPFLIIIFFVIGVQHICNLSILSAIGLSVLLVIAYNLLFVLHTGAGVATMFTFKAIERIAIYLKNKISIISQKIVNVLKNMFVIIAKFMLIFFILILAGIFLDDNKAINNTSGNVRMHHKTNIVSPQKRETMSSNVLSDIINSEQKKVNITEEEIPQQETKISMTNHKFVSSNTKKSTNNIEIIEYNPNNNTYAIVKE